MKGVSVFLRKLDRSWMGKKVRGSCRSQIGSWSTESCFSKIHDSLVALAKAQRREERLGIEVVGPQSLVFPGYRFIVGFLAS
jgi:hypothetical protein